MADLPLTVVSKTALRITVGWTPVVGAAGYVFSRDGKRVSNTWDPSKSQVTFSIPDSQPHTFSVEALQTLSRGELTVNEPAPPPIPPSGAWWAGPQHPDTTPPPVPAGATKITSPADLKTVCSSGGRGGQYVAAGFTYTGNLDIGNHAGLELWLDESVKLVGPAGSALPAVGVHGRGVKVYGGDVSNPDGGSGRSGGDGVKAYVGSGDSAGPDFLWHGLRIHDCAAQGYSSQGSRFAIHGDVSAEISRCGLNPSLDPHAIKGTGLHACYLGGGDTPTTGRYILVVHDQPTGAACQTGAHAQCELWLAARNLTWTKDRYAGNAFQPWGAGNAIVVKSLLVDGAQVAIFTESLNGGSATIEFCRYRNIRLAAVQANSHLTVGDLAAA